MASWGDEAADALRRLFRAADEGMNIEDVIYPQDAPSSMENLRRLLGPANNDWMTPEQRALHEAAAERQRQYAADIARRREEAMIARDLEDTAVDEEFLIRLRQMGFDV